MEGWGSTPSNLARFKDRCRKHSENLRGSGRERGCTQQATLQALQTPLAALGAQDKMPQCHSEMYKADDLELILRELMNTEAESASLPLVPSSCSAPSPGLHNHNHFPKTSPLCQRQTMCYISKHAGLRPCLEPFLTATCVL